MMETEIKEILVGIRETTTVTGIETPVSILAQGQGLEKTMMKCTLIRPLFPS